MNIKLIFFTIFLICFSFNASADQNFPQILKRQHVACGTDAEYSTLAYTKDNQFSGFDVDICRALASAFLGNAESFKIIPVTPSSIGQALNSGKIDIMLGNTSLSSSQELQQNVIPVDTLYFPRQIFASRTNKEAKSMKDFAGSRICVIHNSIDADILNDYNQKYALGFKILETPDLASAKANFYLNRCDLITSNEIFIKDITSELKSKSPAKVLPEEIAYLPVKAYSSARDPELNTALRWILNALKLAQSAEINSQTIQAFNSTKSKSLQNLLGINPKAWQSLGLYPDWAKDYISVYGNYQQILERNLGPSLDVNIDLQANDLIGRGGFLSYQPFL